MHNDDTVTAMMAELGCTAKRVTKELIESRIVEVDYQIIHLAGQKLMYCGIRMDTGFVAVGKPATCISPENWRDEIGQRISYDNSFGDLWKLEAYRMLAEKDEAYIARVAHEINKAYCDAIGDTSQVDWDSAPDWQKKSALTGVKFHLDNPDASPSASHDSWLAEKVADGWVYGEVKDVDAKTHPCCVPYDQLPVEQKAKDYLFKQTVHSLK